MTALIERRQLAKSASRRASALRKAWLIACMLLGLVVLSGCSGGSPRATAQRYLDYLQQFNYAACYGMLSAQDKKDRDFSTFLTAIPLAPDTSPLWFRAVLHSTHYELGAVQRIGDRAVAAVKITTPDLPLWERTLDAAAGPDHIGGDEAVRSLDTGNYPKLTYSDRIVLTKEHHRWRILASLAVHDHIMDQYRKAVALYDQSNFEGAVAAYRKLLTLADQFDGTGSGAMKVVYGAELARTEEIVREHPLSQAYIESKLKLSNVAMKMSEDRVPGIFGTIANAGSRALDQVALAVTWYEGRGKGLHQVFREQHEIVITPLQFTDFSRPVVPFLPGAAREFGFILTAPAEVQQNASPYVTVSAIVFTASPAPLPVAKTISTQAPSAKRPSAPLKASAGATHSSAKRSTLTSGAPAGQP